jgi:hypothetical protein
MSGGNKNPDEPPSERAIRNAGLKSLWFSGGWFVVVVFLFVSGLAMEIYEVCMMPSRAVSGRLLGSLMGVVGSFIWLTLMIGWLIPLPNALYMISTGRQSRSLNRLFPLYFGAPRSKPGATRRCEREDGERA